MVLPLVLRTTVRITKVSRYTVCDRAYPQFFDKPSVKIKEIKMAGEIIINFNKDTLVDTTLSLFK